MIKLQDKATSLSITVQNTRRRRKTKRTTGLVVLFVFLLHQTELVYTLVFKLPENEYSEQLKRFYRLKERTVNGKRFMMFWHDNVRIIELDKIWK